MPGNRPEILAPAGSFEALLAAVRCGADAVYLGGGNFNARRNAPGFSAAELEKAAELCRLYGAKLYFTLNTLIKEDEWGAALAMAETACRIGADAILIQDLGLAAVLRRAVPDMPLHASTQMSVHTPEGVKELVKLGFARVVLAREMSAAEVRACAGLGAELEVFVHGALCMSVSGQCFFSSALGGRSANRGLCAQPCRLPFAYGQRSHALSLKDLCALDHIQELTKIGVAALKIEGRMKRPEYVAAAVSLYRKAVDGENISQEDADDLQAIFSRSGFTDGYLHTEGKPGSAMFGFRTKNDVIAADPALKKMAQLYKDESSVVALSGGFRMRKNEPVQLTASDGIHKITVTGDVPEPAQNRPLDPVRAKGQLEKTGGTPYYFTELKVEIEDGLTLSAASLNALRRNGLAELGRARAAFQPVTFTAEKHDIKYQNIVWTARQIVRLASPNQYTAALREAVDILVLPLSKWQPIAEAVELPRGMFGQEESIRQKLQKAAANGAKYAVCHNLGAIKLALEAGLAPIGGFWLHITNSHSLEACAALGLVAATLSPELKFRETGFAKGILPAGLLLYGRQPLMLTRNCPKRCAGGDCGSCRPEDGLKDRTGAVFPVMCEGGCAEVYNAVPIYWADKLEELPELDFQMLYFTTETADETAEIARYYQTGGPRLAQFTRGSYRRGVL